jgi:sterol desaturase/sphingolipid hydroxylase (fatty acid hydroxylase superfamily)
MFPIFVFILSYDLWFYISHLMLHHRSLYKYHKQHHTHVYPIWVDTNDASTFENVVQSIGLFLPLLYYQSLTADFVYANIITGVRGLMRHDDRCTFLIGNHHLLHHKYPSYNFGEYWLDSLCGTMYPNRAEHKRGLLFFL